MNRDDYDKLSELLERWCQRACHNGYETEYTKLCHEMEQRGVLYALDALIDVGAWETRVVLNQGRNL